MYFSSKCEPICQPNILFHSLQVQPINVKNGTFSYAYDCTGFFNIPILMGLITTGVLLIILFIAVLVMFSLTTMDRFDDPKGPTIHVATGQTKLKSMTWIRSAYSLKCSLLFPLDNSVMNYLTDFCWLNKIFNFRYYIFNY